MRGDIQGVETLDESSITSHGGLSGLSIVVWSLIRTENDFVVWLEIFNQQE